MRNDKITFEDLPNAIQHLLNEVTAIKNHLLNQAAITKEPVLPSPEKKLMTVADVSQMLNISKGTIYNMTSTRQIPCFKRVGRIYFDRKEIDEWIRDYRRKTIKQLQDEVENKIRKK